MHRGYLHQRPAIILADSQGDDMRWLNFLWKVSLTRKRKIADAAHRALLKQSLRGPLPDHHGARQG
jgi:hypothetical protein